MKYVKVAVQSLKPEIGLCAKQPSSECMSASDDHEAQLKHYFSTRVCVRSCQPGERVVLFQASWTSQRLKAKQRLSSWVISKFRKLKVYECNLCKIYINSGMNDNCFCSGAWGVDTPTVYMYIGMVENWGSAAAVI